MEIPPDFQMKAGRGDGAMPPDPEVVLAMTSVLCVFLEAAMRDAAAYAEAAGRRRVTDRDVSMAMKAQAVPSNAFWDRPDMAAEFGAHRAGLLEDMARESDDEEEDAMDADAVASSRGDGALDATKALVEGVLQATGYAEQRSAKLDIDDFMALLAKFNEAGIHCRPSSVIVSARREFEAAVLVQRGADACELGSVMDLLSLGLEQGEDVTIRATGRDEAEACACLVALFERHFDFPPRASVPVG